MRQVSGTPTQATISRAAENAVYSTRKLRRLLSEAVGTRSRPR